MFLVIAEKPSVAQAIAKVLGATAKKDGYIEGGGYLVSWCIGHLVNLASAESYDEKLKKWELSSLPIIPKVFQYAGSKDKAKQLKQLCSLLNRNDVQYVVNACDAGREGELIFRLVFNYAKSNKPIKRLWISSMEDSAIKDGFQNLKDGKDFDLLYASALCRSRADWIVGINATRLFSCLYNQQLNVGRVMSPTLSMIVERNAIIKAFKSEPFYTVILEKDGICFTSDKMKDKALAETLLNTCKNQSLVIKSAQSKEKSEKPPKLYDLTTLQREANRKLGFTASQTLEYTQSLYEKKIVTYPRTDSKFLTEDMAASVPALVVVSANKLGFDNPTCNAKQIIDNSKVSDHHGIVPTKSFQGFDIDNLPYGEKAVLTLIMLRLLCATGESHKYCETVVTANVGETIFTCKGTTVIAEGFKLYLKNDDDNAESLTPLPIMGEGEILENVTATIKDGKTTPPKQFTEDSILSAMETAGQDENIDKEFCGIGTPATRAGVIEKLIAINLLERKGDKKTKYLVPTDKGNALITILPEAIASPLMTAQWEEKLKSIELDGFSPDAFMGEISDMVKNLVSTYDAVKGSEKLFPSTSKVIGKCPRCGGDIAETKKTYSCVNSACGFALWKDNKFFTAKKKALTEKITAELLKTGKVKLTGCHSEKTGKSYDCTVSLDDSGGKYVNFKMEFGK